MAETWQYSRREKQRRHSQNRIRSSWRDWSRRTSYGNGRIRYFQSDIVAIAMVKYTVQQRNLEERPRRETTLACLPRHPAVAYLFLVRWLKMNAVCKEDFM